MHLAQKWLKYAFDADFIHEVLDEEAKPLRLQVSWTRASITVQNNNNVHHGVFWWTAVASAVKDLFIIKGLLMPFGKDQDSDL